jgi:predicted ATPase
VSGYRPEPDVFISYSTRDRAIAERVREQLENAGVRCWIAPRDIPSGYDWSAAIPPAIDACRAFVLIFSAHANASKQVTREVHVAQGGAGRPVIPFRIDAVEPAGALRYLLSGLHWLDATADPHASVGALVERVRRLFEEASSSPDDSPKHDEIQSNLPNEVDRFFGRDGELAEFAEAIREHRLVTIVGAGGVGKTRLALRLGRGMRREFPDGVRLAELGQIRDAALVAPQVAGAIEAAEAPGTPLTDTIVSALGSKRLLLVIDNCEHVLDASAALVSNLIAEAADVHILCTSRQPLGTVAERVCRLEPLALPKVTRHAPTIDELNASPAVRLFLDRAGSATTVSLGTEAARAAVAAIVARLDGIPLALELAAARAKTISFEQIAAAIERRFRLLTSGKSGALPHHQTLRALIAWSVDQLDDAERSTFRRLGLFAGQFSLDPIVAICGEDDGPADELDVLDTVDRLVDRSLVSTASVVHGKLRYRLLESVRAFAAEALDAAGERHAVDGRLVAYAFESVRAANESSDAHATIDAELDVVRTVLQTVTAQPDTIALGAELMNELDEYWISSGRWAEAQRWYTVLTDSNTAFPADARAKLLLAASAVAIYREDYEYAVNACRAVLDEPITTDDRSLRARALNLLAVAEFSLGSYDVAKQRWTESLAIHRDAQLEAGTARVLSNLGMVAWEVDDRLDDATGLYAEALAIFRRTGPDAMKGLCLGNLAEIAYAQGDDRKAIRLASESLDLYRALGNETFVADRALLLAKYSLRLGDLHVAKGYVLEALRTFDELEQKVDIGDCLLVAAEILARSGAFAPAMRLFDCGASLRRLSKREMLKPDRRRVEELERLLGAARDREFEQTRASTTISMRDAVNLAFTSLERTALAAPG